MRELGKTGLSVSVLGLGTVKWGRTLGLKYPTPVTLPDDDELNRLLRVARDHGMNLIDTAPAYGIAEERIGRLIDDRESWVIATKFGEQFTEGVSRFDFSSRALRESLDASLRRLRTDRVDLLLVHSDGQVEHRFPHDLIEALMKERDAGRVRAIGISSKTKEGGFAALDWADVLMVTLNPEYREEVELIREASRRGVGILVKKALLSGHGGGTARPSIRECLATSLLEPGVSSIVIGSVSSTNVENNARIADDILARGDVP